MNNILYDWKKIGERIKQERKKKGLSLENLSEQLGITRQTLSKWEKGEAVEIGIYSFTALCNIFNCEIGYILCEYDCKTRAKTDISKETGLSEKSIERLSPSLAGTAIQIYTQSRVFERKALNNILEFNNGDILALISEYLYSDEKDIESTDGKILTAETIATAYLLEISGELQALRKKINGGIK